MQIKVKSARKLKDGTNQYGAWSLYKIEATDGKLYTTLAEGAEALTTGAVFEPAEVMLGDEKDGVQEYKFKKFKLVAGGSAPSSGLATEKNGMTPEAWEKKDHLERESRERNTCYMGIMSLATSEQYSKLASSSDILRDRLITLLNLAFDYAEACLGKPVDREAASLIVLAPAKDAEDKDWEDLTNSPADFPNIGSLLTRVTKELKLTTADICKELGVNDVKEITDFKMAWDTLKAPRTPPSGQ